MLKGKCVWAGVLALAATAIFGTNGYASSSDTDFNIKVNPSLSLSVSSANVGFQLTPSKAGSYDSAAFNVYSATNNTTGYTLTMSTEKTYLESNTVNPTTGTKPTIPTLTETQDGITASAFENSTSSDVLNHWGISVAGANYNAMKSSQQIKQTTVNNATEDTTAISLASKLNLLTVPGVYSTTINFQLVANIYTEGGSINESSEKYPANSLLRAFEIAYTEAGKPMYIEDANTDIGWRPMVGTDYATVGGKEVRFAMQDITMTFEENGQTKNVCEWAASSTVDLTDPYNAIITYADTALVMDLRDGNSYNIVKAADGRCWMQDNLALNPLAQNTTLTESNTNASTEAITNYLNGSESALYPGWSTAKVKVPTGSDGAPTTPKIIVSYKDDISSNQLDQAGEWKLGVFYNQCAAAIGTFCYSNAQDGDKSGTDLDIEQDVCPAGWRLPIGNWRANGGEAQSLLSFYPDARIDGANNSNPIRNALHLPFSGQYAFDAAYLYYKGESGSFWTASSTNGGDYVGTVGVGASSSYVYEGHRAVGNSIRCIAK